MRYLKFASCYFIILSLSPVFSYGQLSENDQQEIRILTNGLKTYSVKFVTHDTVIINNSENTSLLKKHFKFLKEKNMVWKEPDFSFNILIDLVR